MSDAVERTYVSLSAFYADRPARRGSRERDVGLFWRSGAGRSYRAAWVRDTGETYLFQHAVGSRGGGTVHLVRAVLDEPELERRLAGWGEICGSPHSLEWLLARLGEPDIRPRPPVSGGRSPARRFGSMAPGAA